MLEGRELMRGVSSLMARAQLRNGGQPLVHPRWLRHFGFAFLDLGKSLQAWDAKSWSRWRS